MSLYYKKYLLSVLLVSAIFTLGLVAPDTDEGMYPLSEIQNVDLVKAGLKINPKEIYDPNGISLIDALVKVGGCTGSFISNEGLIITNHHCAFGAINKASTTENNYLEDGFLAKNKNDEIPAKGYKCRITESYEDVSGIILDAAKNAKDLAERTKLISRKMNELNEQFTDKANSIEAQVSEMFAGQSYILFKYRIIEDVRIVYAPPRAIGEFGGESDNWVWPRHTGDFTFMRAYVSPDGKSAEYSENNVPFKPKKFLKVNPNGVDDGDFVFILGYPGRTYRHEPSQFLEYQQQFVLPYVSELYEWVINLIEQLSENDEAMALKYASAIKGYANTMKNYKGKLKGIRKIQLVEKKQEEEKLIRKFLKSDPKLKMKYADLFDEIENTYKRQFEIAQAELWFQRFPRLSNLYAIGNLLVEYLKEMDKPENERSSSYREQNLQATLKRVDNYYNYLNEDIEMNLWARMIEDAINIDSGRRIKSVDEIVDQTENDFFIPFEDMLNNTNLFDRTFFDELIKSSYSELSNSNDPFVKFMVSLNEEKELVDKESNSIEGALSILLPELAEVKRLYNQKSFIPDANGTLRLTYGHIKGYSPADAVYYNPFTTLEGVIEKSYLGGEYTLPDKVYQLYEAKDFGKFYNPKIGGIPVGLLYNMDTTGGNSGSPILNAYGELIGVNFDRAFEATINDYAWNESYSRSIGVDIRYVLWITQKLGGADYLLQEMGVNL